MQITDPWRFLSGAFLMAEIGGRIYKVGQRVEKWCAVCDELRGHIVASINVRGHVTRVSCPICGTRGPFKNGNSSAARSAGSQEAQPYDWTHTYRVKQLLNHPSYGLGEVVAVIDSKKIDVLFADRIRRMVQGRESVLKQQVN